MRVAVVDGDIFVYESACRGERHFSFGEQSAVHVDEAEAVRNFDTKVETVRDHCSADKVIIALSDPARRYWRHDILPDYKAGRGGPRPAALQAVREHAATTCITFWRPTLEADDVMGILATGAFLKTLFKVQKLTPIVVTTDKDLKQIPGLHLNPQKLDEGLFNVTAEEGNRWHLMQTLMGDPVDGYKGCPGIGPKKADKIVDRGWEAVVETFESRGLTRDEALRQARVARILRAGEWDAKNAVPILWEPKDPTCSSTK